MVFNDDLLFIHVGKTGGMSCSNYLLSNLQPPIYNCHARSETDKWSKDKTIIPVSFIGRHSTLEEAIGLIESTYTKKLEDFKKVIVVIRHPYELEYSYYRHLQKPEVAVRNVKTPRLIALANIDFESFVKKGGYHRQDHPQEKFFLLDGQVPQNVEVIKFENLSTDFPKAVQSFLRHDSKEHFPHVNNSGGKSRLNELLTSNLKRGIYKKHQYMFDQGYYNQNTWPSMSRDNSKATF